MTALQADDGRKANDAIRGYVYQVLRSVLAWLDLKETEDLYLEGAEDIDLITGAYAQVDQVKDTAGSGKVTLRTASALKAVNHYWAHRARNQGIPIIFRYVTTSAVGIETEAPFGPQQSGIALWNRLRESTDPAGAGKCIGAIVTFLLAQPGLSPELRAFLDTASPADVLKKLIRPIEWCTGQEDGTALVRRIKDRLVNLGGSTGVSPGDADLVFDALYVAAFTAAQRKEDIPLTSAEFKRLFAAATSAQVPKQDLVALARALTSTGATGLTVQTAVVALEGAPPLPARYFPRTAGEANLARGLAEGAVLLIGSTGSGKTLMAASALSGRSAFWLTLRDLNPFEAKARLEAARVQLLASGVPCTLVVDDIDALADPRLIEAALGALWNCLKALGGSLIMSCDRDLPARLAQATELQPTHHVRMEALETDEIAAFLRTCGCPEDAVDTWAQLLTLSTLGHPQLVNARVSTLAADNFPAPTPADLLQTTSDLEGVRTEARRLIAGLPVDARELLYRASLIAGRVSRKRLMSIARLRTSIAEPGEAIDIIAGPWLELMEDGEYRVSPLARGAAVQARDSSWVREMHAQLAWTYLIDRTITPWDISSVLMHCFMGQRAGPLVHIIQSVLSASEDVWAAIGEACSFYASLALADGDSLPFRLPADQFVFRTFQYRIAAEGEPDTARRLAAKIEAEFAAAPEDEVTLFFRFLYLSQFLQVTKVKYPTPYILAQSLAFFDVARTLQDTFPDRWRRAGHDPLLEDEDAPAGGYAVLASLRLSEYLVDIADLTLLADTLRRRSAVDARAMLDGMCEPAELGSMRIEGIWLTEFRKAEPDWRFFVDQLRAVFDFAVEVGALVMARTIGPTLLRAIDEDLGETGSALSEADRIGPVLGDDPLYLCAYAKVLHHGGQYARALPIWTEAIPRWPAEEGPISGSFASRAAAIAAGLNCDWARAADFFETARTMASTTGTATYLIGLDVDSAYCRYLADEPVDAVDRMARAVAAVKPMQAELQQEPLLSLQRRFGGILAALADGPSDGWTADEYKNLVGLCSNLDPFETAAPHAPPLASLQMNLLRLDIVNGGSVIGMEAAKDLRACNLVSFVSVATDPLFALAQATREFGPVIADGLRQLDALAMMQEQQSAGARDVMARFDGCPRAWTPGAEELLISRMIVAVFDLAASNELDRLPLRQWREDAAAHSQGERVVALVDHLNALFVTFTINPWEAFIGSSATDWSHHAATSLAATLLDSLAPSALVQCHGLWPHLFVHPHIHKPIGDAVGRLIVGQWRRLAAVPAIFSNPRVTLPPLLAAIADDTAGWVKARAVLQASLDGAAVPAADNARRVIESMID